MNQSWSTGEVMHLVGMQVRTNNAAEVRGEGGKISPTINRYFTAGLPQAIPDQIEPGVTYSVFTDYADEIRGDYTYFVGARVASLDQVPSELATLTIPVQAYAVFAIGPSPMPEACIEAWRSIWQMSAEDLGGKRAFIADFERYDHRSEDPAQACFDIYVGVQRA